MLIQALAEVTTLAEKGGIDRAAFLEFLSGTVLACEWVRARTPDLVALDWTPTFTTELMRKDFDLGRTHRWGAAAGADPSEKPRSNYATPDSRP